jgi:adenylate cyclase
LKRYWLSTAVLFAVTLALGSLLSYLFEAKIYDQKVRLYCTAAPADIVLAKIDQGSIDFYSREFNITWPWPRSLYAKAIDYLTAAGARAVAMDLIFSEPSPYSGEDEQLAAAMKKSGRVFLPLVFSDNEGGAEGLERFALAATPPLPRLPEREGKVTLPVPLLRDAARGLGNAQADPERDHIYRRLRHFVRRGGRAYPSFSLAVATVAAPGLDPASMAFAADGGVNLRFYRKDSFRTYAIAQLIQSQVQREAEKEPAVPLAELKDKIVIIGATATGLLDNRATPVNASGSGFELHATAMANLLRRDFIRVFNPRLQWLLVLLAIALLNLSLSRINTLSWQLLIALVIIALALATNLFLFRSGIDLDFIPLFIGLVACSGYDAYGRYQRVRREKKFIEKAFKGYMSDSLLAEIMKNPAGLHLGGEKKLVTVFFSDLAGFTSLSEKLPAEEVVRVLNIYLERMTAVIMENGGFVNKFEGDAIMAFWGAPLPDERHAERAMHAALLCQDGLQALNEEFARDGLPRLNMRVGINSGEVIVGNIGSRQRFEYTVIGDAVNLASRLEGINKQYGTAIIGGSLSGQLAAGELLLRRLDRVRVKGKNIPEEIFEVVAGRENAPPGMDRIIDSFAKGLSLYFAGDFAAAAEIFSGLPNDPPSQVFARRCHFLLAKPPEHWDGAWTFTEK